MPICFARVSHLNVHFEVIMINHKGIGFQVPLTQLCALLSGFEDFLCHVSGCLALHKPKKYISVTSVHHALRLMQDEALGPASQEFYSGL